jgi:hypothetical protein
MTKYRFDNQKDHATKELVRQFKHGDKYAQQARREMLARQVAIFEGALGCEVTRHKPLLICHGQDKPEMARFFLDGLTLKLATSSGVLTVKDLNRIKVK